MERKVRGTCSKTNIRVTAKQRSRKAGVKCHVFMYRTIRGSTFTEIKFDGMDQFRKKGAGSTDLTALHGSRARRSTLSPRESRASGEHYCIQFGK